MECCEQEMEIIDSSVIDTHTEGVHVQTELDTFLQCESCGNILPYEHLTYKADIYV